MANTVDLDLLRQVKTDSLRVYDALHHAEMLTAETEHVLKMAEDLLHKAGLAYLLEGVDSNFARASESRSTPEAIVSAYVQIQQAYVELKHALYQLAKEQMKVEAWDDARATLRALMSVDPTYGDTAAELRESYWVAAAKYFEANEWQEGRTELKAMQLAYREGTESQIELLRSFVNKARKHGKWADEILEALRQYAPTVIGLPSFREAMKAASSYYEDYREWSSHLDSRISYSSYGLHNTEYNAEQDRLMRRMIASNKRLSDSLDELEAYLYTLLDSSTQE